MSTTAWRSAWPHWSVASHARSAAAAVLVTLGTSCAAPATSLPTEGADSSPTSAASPARTPVPTPPLELQGTWTATISTGETVTLELSPYNYRVLRGPGSGEGGIAVEGNRIVFSSPRCDRGNGPYEWALEDGELTFVPLEPRDPCDQRIIFLENATYTKVE